MTGRRDRRPPALASRVRRSVLDHAMFARGERVLVAVSGGPDSTALLHVLASLRDRLGHELAACGVDHGLRPEAAGELDRVAALCATLAVPFERSRVVVAPGSNLQARARTARWGALLAEKERTRSAVVATGHTADDRAETLVLRLLRGAGPRGLAVLPPRDGDKIRPLLHARRSEVLAHLARHDLGFAEDPSNADPRFLRVRVRREVMPLLEELSPRIVEALAHLADALAPLRAQADPLEGLGRAQRFAVERALRLGRGTARVRIAGARDLVVERAPRAGSGGPEVEPGARESGRRAFPDGSPVLIWKIDSPAPHRRDRRR